MKKLKRSLALALVLCMMCSFLPVGVFAAGNTADNAVPESNEAVIQATSALTPVEPNRPEDGSTQNQPFPSYTAGSQYFRIPAITTLSNGNLVAAADARWNDIYDKGNIDTLVSISEDNGANWNYTFANYIDDGGNTFNISAATFIDPAMAVKTVDGVETIYMVADLFPGQASGSTMCIHAALYGTGMSDDGHLLVSDKNDNTLSDFHYYVGDYTDGVAPLCNSDGTATDYVVDEWFNVYKNGTHLGNLFTYGDVTDGSKTFYVYQTSYLALTKSTDGGKTWSAPTLLNHQVKNASEKFYGVGPASGIVTSDGTIMFTAYTFTTSDGKTSTFYSKDNGVTWERGADLNRQSSEAALAEGNNGVVYLFNRYGQVCYTSDYGENWTYLSEVGYAKGCEVSALTYSKPIDGKKAILVCGPTSGRYGGKIFVGLINDDNSITWKYNYAVNTTSDPFQYSSMTELADGSIGLLYENTVNTTAGVIYENFPIKTILGEDAVIGTPEETISLTVGETHRFKLDEVVDSGSHTSDAADVTWTKVDTTVSVPAAQLGTDTSFSGSTIDLNECLYTFTKNSEDTWLLSADVNGTTVYIDAHAGAGNGGYPNRTYTTNITLINGSNGGIQIYDGAGYLHFYDTDGSKLYWDQCTGNSCSGHNLKIYKVADTASTTVLGGYYEQVTDIANLEDGGKYLIVGYNSSTALAGYYAMHPSVSTGDKYSHLAKITGGFTETTTSETTVEIQAKAVGSTSVEIGSTKYNITVQPAGIGEYEREEHVELTVGHSKTYTDNTGNYEKYAGNVQPDASIATMTVTGADAVSGGNKMVEVTATNGLAAGKQYIIVSERSTTNGLLTSDVYTATIRWSGLEITGLKTNGTVSADTSEIWTITPNANGKYAIKHGDQYLTLDYSTTSTASLTDTETYLNLNKMGNYWYITNDDGDYLSNVGGFVHNYFGASGFNETGGSGWQIYEIVDSSTSASTTIIFEGVAPGTTTAVVGNTKYNISVTPAGEEPFEKEENVMLLVGESKTYTDDSGNYEASYTGKGLDENIATVTVKGTTVEGSTTVTPVTKLTTDDTFYIQVSEGVYRTANGGTTTILAEAELWTVKEGGGSYGRLMNEAGDYLIVDNGALTSQTAGNTYFNFDGYTYEIYYQTATVNITVGVPLKINVTEAKDVTDITITGNSEGTTSVIVGKTRYNITVVSAYDCVTSENSPFVVGGNFIGSVTNNAQNEGLDYLTRLTMSSVMTKENLGGGSGVGYQVDLSSAFDDAESISWSIADESIAKIEVSEDGKSVYVTAADANTTGTTYLSCTIDGKTYTIPVVIIKTTDTTANGSWKYNSLHIAEIIRSDVWYSWNNSGDADQFVKAVEGEAIWTVFDKSDFFAINFYAAPDARHALTFMSATNSKGQYHTLADKENPRNCDYFTKAGSGYDQRTSVGFTDDQVANDIKAALDLGCDGAQGFSRGSNVNNAVDCNLTFISDPMVQIDKTVDGVLPTTRKMAYYRRYTENMVASVGEQVYFKITLTLKAPTQWMPYDASKHADSVVVDGVTYGTDANGNRYSAITYSNAIMTDDVLAGAFLYNKEIDNLDGKWDGNVDEEYRTDWEDVTEKLNAAWTAEELAAGQRVYELYLVYEIVEEDIPKFYIDNIAELDFQYKSHYSTGAQAGAADAEAKITVVGSVIDDVVIDFGQIVTYQAQDDDREYVFSGLTNAHLKGAFVDGEYNSDGSIVQVVNENGKTESGATAKFGEVKVYRERTGTDNNGEALYSYTIIYTPNAILLEPDAVQIMGIGLDHSGNEVEKVINGFMVYPATTVYYEEGFMLNDASTWNNQNAAKATVEQAFELLGVSQFDTNGTLTGKESNKLYAYGYDPLYEDENMAHSYASSNTIGDTTSFKFTGTGFDLYADCTDGSGYVAVMVQDSNGKYVKMFTVDTAAKKGETAATGSYGTEELGLPIVSVELKAHGTYTVTVTKIMDTDTVKLDGIRIHNTYLESDSREFSIDKESGPMLFQMRDYVLSSVDVNNLASKSYGEDWLNPDNKQLIGALAGQVFNQVATGSVAIVTSVENIYGSGATAQDLLDNGPKNELFLFPGQTLSFSVTLDGAMQIGLKAPRGDTSYKLYYTYSYLNENAEEQKGEVTKNADLSTSVDMFYELSNPVGANGSYKVSVTNTGDDILSVTDLKVSGGAAVMTSLTEEDIEDILLNSLGMNKAPEVPEVQMPFADVHEDSFYYESVLWAVENGITNGVSAEHFGPDVNCNRAQVVTFLWRAAGSPEPSTVKHGFVDVEAGSFYEKAVLWAVEKGITNGTDATHFSPNLECNRATVVTFLYRAIEDNAAVNGENPFSDVAEGQWYTAPILWAVENGITNGMGGNVFGVENICNRAQIVTFLYRAMN